MIDPFATDDVAIRIERCVDRQRPVPRRLTPRAVMIFDHLRNAQLLAQEQLVAAGAVAARSRSAQDFADQLVRNKLLTEFQADQAVQGFAHELVIRPYHLLELRGGPKPGAPVRGLQR